MQTHSLHPRSCLTLTLILTLVWLLLAGSAATGNPPVETTADKSSALADEKKTIPNLKLAATDQALVARVFPSRPGDFFVQLTNGLTILIRESHMSKTVASQVSVQAGSIYEANWMTAGLSHYLEHVVAGGATSAFTEAEAKKTLEELGGATNAYTSTDHTVFFINTVSDRYKKALFLLMNYVSTCAIDETAFNRERQVIIQEMRMNETNPDRILNRLFLATAYRENPIRYPVIGYEDVFKRVTRQDLLTYYKTRYVPQNTIVTVVGDVNPHEALNEIIKLSRDWARGTQVDTYVPAEPEQLTDRRVEKESPLARLGSISVGYKTVSLTAPDMYPLDVLAIILGQGKSSRLHRVLRDERNLALGVSCSSYTPSGVAGMFIISMNLPYQNQDQAMEVVNQEIDRLRREPVNLSELERAKRAVMAQRVFSRQSVEGQAADMAENMAQTGDPYFEDNYNDRIQQVTPAEITRVVNTYFRNDHRTVAVLRPAGAEKAKPEAKTEPQAVRPVVEKKVLPNGLTLLISPIKSLPMVNIMLVGRGGLAYEPKDKPGLSRFMADMLFRGTTTRTKPQIDTQIESLGGAMGAGSGRNTFFVKGQFLKEDLDQALVILTDVLRNPGFDPKEMETERRDTLLAIKKRDESWQAEVEHLFRTTYFKDHPYHNDILGTSESVTGFSRDDLVALHRQLMTPGNLVLAVYGDVESAKVAAKVQELLGSMSGQTPAQPAWPHQSLTLTADTVVSKPTEKASDAIMIGYNGVDLKDPDRADN
ncbi:MAG: insulinase family protein [Deltaproteobacteria bacterium]|nr:insulinase family protein [Deltaproteobacteria bacterium]